MTVAVEPLTMPQMSPTTSLQNEATFSALRMRYSASFAPLTRCAAIELNGLGFAAVTATPMISNRMPSAMNSSRISVATTYPASSSSAPEHRLIAAESATAIKNTRMTQRAWLGVFSVFFCFRSSSFSKAFFSTVIS